MARENMITRTITGTKATCMVVDIEKGETFTEVLQTAHEYKDEKKLFAVLKKQVEGMEGEKALVKILDTEPVSKLLGLTEADFMKYAVELDPVTRKRI